MRSPDFTPTAEVLPALYQEDPASFAQVDTYLGLADSVLRAVVQTIEDLPAVLGPDASLRWPAEVPLDAGAPALHAHQLSRYDDVAEWVAYAFPSTWGNGDTGVRARRRFLGKAARLWRRRGTPRGFVDWFSVYFGCEDEQSRPFLLEHHKVAGGDLDAHPYTGTLFVPATATFADWARRLECAEFARWYAPAHVDLRVCFVPPGMLDTFPGLTTPARLGEDDSPAAVAAYEADLLTQAQLLRELACSVVSVVSHANGIHLYGCPADDPPATERSIDHLGIGVLPTDEG